MDWYRPYENFDLTIGGIKTATDLETLVTWFSRYFGEDPNYIKEANRAESIIATIKETKDPILLAAGGNELLRMDDNARKALGMTWEEWSRYSRIGVDAVKPADIKIALQDKGSAIFEGAQDAIAAVNEANDSAKDAKKAIRDKYLEINAQASTIFSQDKAEELKDFRELDKKMREVGLSFEERELRWKLYNEGAKKLQERCNTWVLEQREVLTKDEQAALAAANERLDAAKQSAHKAIIEALNNASPVTEDQSGEWAANNIFIDASGKTKLKNLGYDFEQFKQDCAEFYRLVGGKMGPVEFGTTRGKRAFAKGRAFIAIAAHFNKTTLFHEMGHLVEGWDRTLLESSQDFIKARSSGKPASLKKLTGNNYTAGEVAYPDSFFDPYVGKVYTEYSEVLSMGLQCLASPDAAAVFAKADPEHFKQTIGAALHQNPFIAHEVEKANAQADEKREIMDKSEAWKKNIAKVAGSAFGKILEQEGGYKGFYITAYGRRAAYLYTANKELFSEGAIYNNMPRYKLFIGTLAQARLVAYLYIFDVFPYMDAEGKEKAVKRVCWNMDTAPDWYDPENPLPKV